MESIFGRSPTLAWNRPDKLHVSRGGFFGWLLGCRHRRMSLPVTRDGETYRACANCGAHRMFDVESWGMQGPYYFVAPATASRPYHSTKTYVPVSARGFPVSALPVQDQDGHLM